MQRGRCAKAPPVLPLATTTARATRCAPGRLLWREPFQAGFGQLVEEAALHVVARLAVQHARLRVAEIQPLPRACDRHVHQTALFFQPIAVAHRILVREQALFHAGDEHHIELQPLGRVHGHELHRVLPGLRLVVARFERGVGEEGRERAHGLAGFRLDNIRSV
ncbi:hypothetical protein D9M68_737580 [compost metagenome]